MTSLQPTSTRAWPSSPTDAASRFLPPLLLLAATLLIEGAGVFLAPGFLVLYILPRALREATQALAVVLFTSLTWCAAVFWMAALADLPFSACAHASVIATVAAAWLAALRGHSVRVEWRSRRALIPLAAFGLLAVMRFAALDYAVAPSGADMSMHGYLAALTVLYDGAPTSYEPLLDIPTFSTFPMAFQAVLGLLQTVTGQSLTTLGLFLTAATQWLFALACYVLARRAAPWPEALFATLALAALWHGPMAYISWGGAPTLLALAFAVMLAALTLRLDDANRTTVALAGVCAAGIFLTHTIVFIQSLYVLGAAAIVATVLRGRLLQTRRMRRVGRNVALCVGVFLACAGWYAVTIDPSIATPAVREWIQDWVRHANHGFNDPLPASLLSGPVYLYRYVMFTPYPWHWAGLGLLAVGLYAAWRRHRLQWAYAVTALIAALVLILNTPYWALPLSYLIYPERTATLGLIPVALLTAHGVRWLYETLRTVVTHERLRMCLALLCWLVVGWGLHMKQLPYLGSHINENAVTSQDLEAFRWLAARTAPGDRVLTNYGDAGLWIPAAIGRKVTAPHVNVAYLDKLTSDDDAPAYAFVGARCLNPMQCPHTAASLREDPAWRLVFKTGETGGDVGDGVNGGGKSAFVFERVTPAKEE